MYQLMIRKPEFLKGAEHAKYFPNTAIVVLISLVINIACGFAAIIPSIVYMMSNLGLLIQDGVYSIDRFYSPEFLKPVLIITLFSLALIILFTIIHVRSIEKRPLRTIGLVKQKFALKYIIGFGAGLLLLVLNMGPAFLALPSTFTGFKATAFFYLVAFVFQSAGEEFLFRGYMLSALMRRGGAVWAIVVSSVVFALFHVPAPILALISTALIGAVLSLFVLRTGSLWGAMGLHAAWNFGLGLISSDLGLFQSDYNFLNIVVPKTGMEWLDVMQFAVILAAAALLLFAGKDRLVVRKTEEQILLDKALKTAKKAISGKGQLNYAKRVSELAQGNEGKIAALLYHAIRCGAPAEYIRQEFGEDMFSAIDALAARNGESRGEYLRRVEQYPAALTVKEAERKLEEIKGSKSTVVHNPGAMYEAELTQCPMLRWSITADYCRNIMQAVDNGTANSNDSIAMLDNNICKACTVRQRI